MQSMQNRTLPSFFLTSIMGEDQGLADDSITPCSANSLTALLASLCSAIGSRRGCCQMGGASVVWMWCFTTPVHPKSLGPLENTLENSWLVICHFHPDLGCFFRTKLSSVGELPQSPVDQVHKCCLTPHTEPASHLFSTSELGWWRSSLIQAPHVAEGWREFFQQALASRALMLVGPHFSTPFSPSTDKGTIISE